MAFLCGFDVTEQFVPWNHILVRINTLRMYGIFFSPDESAARKSTCCCVRFEWTRSTNIRVVDNVLC